MIQIKHIKINGVEIIHTVPNRRWCSIRDTFKKFMSSDERTDFSIKAFVNYARFIHPGSIIKEYDSNNSGK